MCSLKLFSARFICKVVLVNSHECLFLFFLNTYYTCWRLLLIFFLFLLFLILLFSLEERKKRDQMFTFCNSICVSHDLRNRPFLTYTKRRDSHRIPAHNNLEPVSYDIQVNRGALSYCRKGFLKDISLFHSSMEGFSHFDCYQNGFQNHNFLFPQPLIGPRCING